MSNHRSTIIELCTKCHITSLFCKSDMVTFNMVTYVSTAASSLSLLPLHPPHPPRALAGKKDRI